MAVVNMTGGEGMPYNLTDVVGSENILDFVRGVNDLTGQTFMLGMLLAGFIILLIAMISHGTKEAIIASGFITTIMAILFYALEFIKGSMLIVIIIIYGIIFIVGVNLRG